MIRLVDLRASLLHVRFGNDLEKIPQRLYADREYETYLRKQIVKSRRLHSYQAPRIENLIVKFLSADLSSRSNRSVLCVGCRSRYELSLLEEAGFEEVVGIDLYSEHPSILPMDMHCMEFPNDAFDVVFACHVLEHSYEPLISSDEFIRVLKPGGHCIIEVPIHFEPTGVDMFDFGSIGGLIDPFEPHISEIILAEEDRDDAGHGSVARLIFRSKD